MFEEKRKKPAYQIIDGRWTFDNRVFNELTTTEQKALGEHTANLYKFI